MGDLTKNFSRSEFACRCGCGFEDIDPALVDVLELARGHFQQPIFVNCGCRCPEHNREVGGAAKSKHMLGIAADIRIKDVAPHSVADWLEKQFPDRYGVGRYPSFTHIDVRCPPARWRG
ncbi:YcbK family protein [Enterobacter roggenkampii]